ncbi:hypothetical protein [Nocardioides sp. B-3]|uniref:hypothetical protein n=1 Tax=Nocardioides sp. B-3 TaxID=2895565 RepID=UPI002152313D|nr:hypothetical protein [Nocardioides sp. B-3]UUZ60750.1 hypothetical protein LP418_08245 [Nocardioides sp. B-3]
MSRRTTTSTTSMPPLGDASACSSAPERVDAEVRCLRGGAQAPDVDAVRRAEERVVAVGELRRTLLEHGEDRAAVVVGHDDGEVWPRLARAEDEPGHVVQERHVAHQRERPGAAVAPERGADGAGDGAVDAGETAVGDHLATPADAVARHHQVEVADGAGGADEEQPAVGQGPGHRTRDFVRRQVGLVPEQRVELSADVTVRRRPGVEPRSVGLLGGRGAGDRVVDPEGPLAPQPVGLDVPDLDVVTREQAADRPREGRVPGDDDAPRSGRRDRCRAGAGRSAPRGCQCASRSSARRTAATARARRAPGPTDRRRPRRPRRCADRAGSRSRQDAGAATSRS